MMRFLCFTLAATLCSAAAMAQETPGDTPASEEVRLLNERIDALELELLQVQANAPAEPVTDELAPVTFHGKARSLQAANPELSFEVDAYGQALYVDGQEYTDSERSGIFLREASIAFQSTLDPFSLVKATLSAGPEGAALEEAYIEYHSIIPRVSLSAGQFRQPFGVVNRWHEHGLDQFDYPLILQLPFGDEGLDATGIGFTWLMPSWWASAQELQLQVTNSENEAFLSGDFFSLPSGLAHLKSYWDLNRDTYIEIGLSGLVGVNNHRGELDETVDPAVVVDEPTRLSWAAGCDLTLNWEPLRQAAYSGVEWRTELLLAQKELPGNQDGRLWGGYTSLTVQAARNLYLSARGEYVRDEGLKGLGDRDIWRTSPGITWWQSEFVRFRLEYAVGEAGDAPIEHRLLLQLSFAAGPHKHERY
jgi:hypothetical protein